MTMRTGQMIIFVYNDKVQMMLSRFEKAGVVTH